MKKADKIILLISILLTSMLFVHDWLYDPVNGPYGIGQVISDILFAGTMYTGLFFVLLRAGYFTISRLGIHKRDK